KEDQRNANNEGVSMVFKRSVFPLEIESIRPNGDKFVSANPKYTLNLELTTKGGVDGSASCFWKLDDNGKDMMKESGSTTHKQVIEVVTGTIESETSYQIFVECVDDATNYAN